jgi:antitoxin VapB
MYTMYMALHITNAEAEKNVRALAAATGETIADAVNNAAKAQLRLVGAPGDDPTMIEDVMEIVRRFDALPILDNRMADEILGYDENGLPT